jgi:iron complex outermembrane receptor protein
MSAPKNLRSVLTLSGGATLALLMTTTALAQAAPEPPAPKGGLELEEIVVTADRKNSFSADLVQAGSFRGARQLDTPLTISVVTSAVLKSQQAVDLIDAMRNTAGVTSSGVGPAVYNNVNIRGIAVDTRSNFRLNGSLPILSSIAFPLEDKDRVEVLKGASALYYGFSNPSGIVNLTMKRPTLSPLFDTTLFGDSHGGAGAAVDLGNTWDKFGARVNAVYANVDTGVKYANGHRYLLSGAFDYRPTDNLTLTLDVETFRKRIVEPGIFRFTTIPTPTVANPYPSITLPPLVSAKSNFGPSWAYNDAQETNALLKGVWKINEAWSLTADVGQSDLERDRQQSQLNPTNYTTGAGQLTINQQNSHFRTTNMRAELAGTFATGPFVHELLIGTSHAVKDAFSPIAIKALCPGATPTSPRITCAQNFFNPVPIPQTAIPLFNADTNRIEDTGYYLFDRVKYGEWLQLLGGVRKSDYEESDHTTGVTTFKAKPTSYSAGIVVKPKPWASLYATYIEGLETTPPAPTTAVNANQQIAPTTSTQKEYGLKIEPRRGLLFQAAYFDIDRGSTYVNGANVYVLDGRARYRGEEFSLTGEVTPELSLFASATFLEAKQISGAPTVLTPTFSPTAVGKRIEATPKTTASVAAEYKLTRFVEGLSVTGAVYYVGNQAVNSLNQAFIPSYTTFDLGVAYSHEIYDHPTTFRINGQNITSKKYWASTGGLFLAESLPSTIKFSVSTSF